MQSCLLLSNQDELNFTFITSQLKPLDFALNDKSYCLSTDFPEHQQIFLKLFWFKSVKTLNTVADKCGSR